jgi:hypothetical protein
MLATAAGMRTAAGLLLGGNATAACAVQADLYVAADRQQNGRTKGLIRLTETEAEGC